MHATNSAPSDGIAVEVRDLVKAFHDPRRGTFRAVDGMSFECRRGEVFGLLGPNGAGKTTTLRVLATILAPTSGRAFLDGIDVVAQPLEARRRLGFLTGNTGLYPRLTGRETLSFFARLHGVPEQRIAARVDELSKTFGMESYLDGRCEKLSTGQKQKISIARAVVHDPPVLILDEPTSGLDIIGSSAMIDFVSARRAAGTCVIFSTHILSEAEELCDRIAIVLKGRVLAIGTQAELCERTGTANLRQAFLHYARSVDPEVPSVGR
ncbi:MAG: ATP-binding cassette domain-containing protein [Planctomycetes bacterium]|nr:ATP-binding cassette domain-containing protein [Planctomycetota bacterium]